METPVTQNTHIHHVDIEKRADVASANDEVGCVKATSKKSGDYRSSAVNWEAAKTRN